MIYLTAMETFVPNKLQPLTTPPPTGKKKIDMFVLLGILCAVALGGVVWLVITRIAPSEFLSPISQELGGKKNQEQKVANPITGELVSPFEAESWIKLRPLGVMVNNHIDARPQSGLIYADIVYEIVAEGGITRYLPFFLSKTPEKIGPVRSTREYYLVLVKELGDAMLMHIGWSPQALEAIETWPVRSLGRGGATFWRDTSRDVAIEHTAYVNGVELRAKGEELGWQGSREFDSWKFKDDPAKYVNEPTATNISVDFWYKGDYSSGWTYSPETNSYLRTLGFDENDKPIPHIDNETKEQISVKNVIVQFAVETGINGDEKNRLSYDLVGSGSGLVFLDGKVIKVTWSKEGRDARTKFYDFNGNEVEFNRGKFWVAIVPDRNVDLVVYN